MATEDSVPKFVSFAADDGVGVNEEEDEERNRKQAQRNRRIRGLLERRVKPVEEKQLGFGETGGGVEKIAPAAPSKPASEDSGEAPPWLALRDEPSINLRLHEELLDFANFMKATPPELSQRQAFVAVIEVAARATLGASCEVHLFGSTSTGLNLPSADIDVVVAGVEGVRATTAMKRIAEWLLQKGEVSQINIVQSARVPVCKMQQRSTGLWADVIINRLDGLETSKFIRDHMEIFPALGPLVLFSKLFLLQRGLHETFGGGLGSYLLVCLVLSFLQRHPSARNPQSHPKTTLGNLLFDLFRHYGQEFRYGAVGISLLNGGSLFDRAARGFTATTRTGQATLCLESPLEAGVDIGARCHKIGVVRAAFNHAYHSLSKLFLSKTASGPSLLVPLLVRQDHDVVANRYALFKEQPPPLLDLPEIPDSDEEEEADAKRRKLNGGSAPVASPAQPAIPKAAEPEAVVFPLQQQQQVAEGAAATEEVDEDELARRHFEMMMRPVDGGGDAPMAPIIAAGSAEVEEEELQMLEELTAEEPGMLEIAAVPAPSPDQVTETCVCGEIFIPGAKFCSECGAKRQDRQDAPLAPATGSASDIANTEEAPAKAPWEVEDPDQEGTVPEAPKDVFAIVGEDEHDLDEAGIFLEAMQEVEALAGSPYSGSPYGGGGSPYGGFASPMADEGAAPEEISFSDDLGFVEEAGTGDAYAVGVEEMVLEDGGPEVFTTDFVAF